MSDQTADIIHFMTKYAESGELKHLEQAKVAVDALWHQHRVKNTEAPAIQIVVNKMVKQSCARKSDVFIKPSVKK